MLVIDCCILHNFCQIERQPEPARDREFEELLRQYKLAFPAEVGAGGQQAADVLARAAEEVAGRGEMQRVHVMACSRAMGMQLPQHSSKLHHDNFHAITAPAF